LQSRIIFGQIPSAQLQANLRALKSKKKMAEHDMFVGQHDAQPFT